MVVRISPVTGRINDKEGRSTSKGMILLLVMVFFYALASFVSSQTGFSSIGGLAGYTDWFTTSSRTSISMNMDSHVNKKKATSLSMKESFDLALQRTTKLLYKGCDDDEREFWLSQPAPTIYIYDNLPPDVSDVNNISTSVNLRFLGLDENQEESGLTNGKSWTNCFWKPKVCSDRYRVQDTNISNHGKALKFMGYRYNFNSGITYVMRFQQSYPYTTTDPSKADLFVVPYPHYSHCLANKDFSKHKPKCIVSDEVIQSKVLDHLTYFHNNQDDKNASVIPAPDRHLFIYTTDKNLQSDYLQNAARRSLSLTLGPVDTRSGEIVTPMTSTTPELQPSVVAKRPNEWWTVDRPIALGAAFGQSKALLDRNIILANWTAYVGTSIGGKPNSIHSLGTGRDSSAVDFDQLYRNSTFCLILMGDNCSQKRFFDVILNGCIPLAKIYKTTRGAEEPAMLHPRCLRSGMYPYAQGSILAGRPFSKTTTTTTTKAGIDMSDIILTFDGDCGFDCMKEPMERLLSNRTALREHQLRLRDYAMLVSLGLSEESYEYPDAFMATIVSLRHRLWDRMGKIPESIL